jgi:hypothetical protein
MAEKNEQDREWFEEKCRRKAMYPLKNHRGPDPKAAETRKRLVERYYQLKIDHALTATHLKRIGRVESDGCWWCGQQLRQIRQHLFYDCRSWTKERKTMLGKIGNKKWKAAQVSAVLAKRENTEAVLEYLASTKVGLRARQVEEEEEERESRADRYGWREDERPQGADPS